MPPSKATFSEKRAGVRPFTILHLVLKKKFKKNEYFSTKINKSTSHHLSHLGEGCVTLLLPLSPHSPWIPIFSTKPNPSARPRNGGLARTSKGPRFHGGFDGRWRIFWHKNGLTKKCPLVINPGNFRELPIFRPIFHGQVGGFEKSADSEAFGGDLWIPLDSRNSGPKGRHYPNYPNHQQVYRVLKTN